MTQTSTDKHFDWRAIFNRRMLICVFTGFASGLPLYLLLQLVPAWLRTEGASLKVIGLLALVQFPYTFKFVWAPFLDRYGILPWLGRRRSWMFISQLSLIAAIAWLGQVSPKDQFLLVVGVTSFIAFLSATQDIALDAYRREVLPDAELGLGNSIHINAYRIGGLVPGALALFLADRMPWTWVFAITAAFMVPGLVMTLMVKEPSKSMGTPRTLRAAVVEPFKEFFGRHGVQSALLVLVFIFLYKLGDSLCTAMATPFYMDMGFTKSEIGIVAKNAGLWPAVIGGLLGGIWMIRLGINRALWLFGVVQVVSIVGFAWLAWQGPPFFEVKPTKNVAPDVLIETINKDVLENVRVNQATLVGDARKVTIFVDNMLRPNIDFDDMAGGVIGDGWSKVSAVQKKTWTDAFHSTLAHDYASIIATNPGATVTVNKGVPETIVNTTVRAANGVSVKIDYFLKKHEETEEKWHWFETRNDKFVLLYTETVKTGNVDWRVVDIVIDGKSLTRQYREQFSPALEAARAGFLANPPKVEAGVFDKLLALLHAGSGKQPSLQERALDHAVESLTSSVQARFKTDLLALLTLALVIGLEAMGVGLGSAAFFAFMARTTHPAYTATQLALFTSLMAVPRTLVNSTAGFLVSGLGGWFNFFWLCFFLAIPGMLLLLKVAPWNGEQKAKEQEPNISGG